MFVGGIIALLTAAFLARIFFKARDNMTVTFWSGVSMIACAAVGAIMLAYGIGEYPR